MKQTTFEPLTPECDLRVAVQRVKEVTDKTDAKCLREGAAHEGEETL